MLHLFASHLLNVLGFVLGGLFAARIVKDPHRAPGSTVAWLLLILLVPWLGVPLYLGLGGRKLKQRAASKAPLYLVQGAAPEVAELDDVQRLLCAAGAPRPRPGNALRLLPTGEEAFSATLSMLEGAQESISVTTFILAHDETGRGVLDRLIDKARQGVRVRLLLDALFGFRAPHAKLAELQRASGRLAWFMPVWHVPFRGHMNLRNHRKLVLVDGRTALVGGMNFAREYMGPEPLPGRWLDLCAELQGPAVADLAEIFRKDWAFASGEELPAPPAAPPDGDAVAQVVGSGPDVVSDRIYDALLSCAFEAKDRLWVATPYFIPDESLARALLLATRRGVDVRILVPRRSNHRSADLAGRSALRELGALGARVLCYEPGMMHAKAVVVDERFGVLGSANMDMRSLFLDYEVALFLSSPTEVRALASWYEALVRSCGGLAAPGLFGETWEGFARLWGPLL